MPGRTDLEGDQVVEFVAPVGSGGEAEPAPGRDLLDGVLKCCGWEVVALVGDYEAVPGC